MNMNHDVLMNVAKAVLESCMQEAAHGRSMGNLDLDAVIASVIGEKPKGVQVKDELVDSLLNLVSELDVHGTPQLDPDEEYGVDSAFGKAKALLHQAGYEWGGKDVGRCNELMTDLVEQSYIKAIEVASSKAGYELASRSLRNSFDGAIMGTTSMHTVQSVGRTAIIHESKNLNRVPVKDEEVNIDYQNGKGIVTVREKAIGQGLGR